MIAIRSITAGCVLAVVALGAWPRCAKGTGPATAAAEPTTAPAATQPADAASLVRQLGDDTAKVRREAAAALRRMGRAALPALKGAVNDDDAQVRATAQALIAEIENPPRASRPAPVDGTGELRGPGGGVIRVAPGGALRIGGNQLRISVTNANGVVTRDVTATEGGRQVHVREGPEGVAVDVTEGGETKSYKAASAAELKEKSPEAWRVFERYSRAGGIEVDGR